MTLSAHIRVMEVVQSLEKGGRTTRFMDTVAGLRAKGIFVLPLCLSQPADWVNIDFLQVLERKQGINWQLVFKIRAQIKSNKINLVHAHCELSQLYAGIASLTCNVKVIGTFHRSDLARYQPNTVNKLLRLLVKEYIAVSYDRLSLLTDNLNFPKQSCHVVHGGTNINNLPSVELIAQEKHALSIDKEQLTLVSIGHLGYIKGHQDTLTALANLKSDNIHLYIAGDGSAEEKEKLNQQIASLALQNKVTFLGQISNPQQWLCACDIFIQPSIEEAFGLVFIEAGAQGKPVIATNVGGIKEIIIDGITGLLVKPSSPKALTEACQQLVDSPEQRNKMGLAAYERVKNNFSITCMIDNYLKIFNQALIK